MAMLECYEKEHQLKIVVVCGADFLGPSEKNALAFALELSKCGHRFLFAVNGQADSLQLELPLGAPENLEVVEYGFLGPMLRRDSLRCLREFSPDVVHAYNPRNPVISAVTQAYGNSKPVVVNFEDDEWGLGRIGDPPLRAPVHQAMRRTMSRLWPPLWPYATKRSLRWVSSSATVLHAIAPALSAEVTKRTGKHCETVLPAYDSRQEQKHLIPVLDRDVPREETIVYTGSVYSAHTEDFRLLLRAIGQLYKRGKQPLLIQAGSASRGYDLSSWAREEGIPDGGFVSLGYLERERTEALLAEALILVQPGSQSEFNRLRLPSKLMSYLASGRPTVTFACGSGELLQDRKEALKTYGSTPEELADRLEELMEDEGLRDRLSVNGPKAAMRLFDAESNSEHLEKVYFDAIESFRNR